MVPVPAEPNPDYQAASTNLKERARAYSADIRATVPRWNKPGEGCVMRASIRNTSQTCWKPTEESGLLVAARWLNLDFKVRVGLAGSAKIDSRVEPGESISVTFDVKFPDKFLPMIAVVDLVDDGVTWFHTTGNRPCRKLVLPRP
jgi:hypothetical protein